MSEPLKDFRPGLTPHTHKYLARIAKARGISLQDLGREIIEGYVANEIHRAKVVLGQDDDNAPLMESRGAGLESHGSSRRAPR